MNSFLFDGQHKSQPKQDYSRASNTPNRDDLLKRLDQDRQKRELNRRQQVEAIKIQNFYRTVRAQRYLTKLARDKVLALLKELKSGSYHEDLLIRLANLVYFGFKPEKDAGLMMLLIESSWQHRQMITEKLTHGHEQLKIAIAKLLKYSVQCLPHFESIRLPTRYIEWYSDLKSYPTDISLSSNVKLLIAYFIQQIIRSGYYTQMCSIVQSKVPANVSRQSRIASIESIIDLLARPVEFESSDSAVRDEALISLRKEFFSRSDLIAIPFLITPVLTGRRNFPIVRYLELMDFDAKFTNNAPEYSHWKLYQLYTVLSMINDRIQELPSSLNKHIVETIRFFICGLITSENAHHDLLLRANRQDDDDLMEIDHGEQNEPNNELLNECIAILNKRPLTKYLFDSINRSKSSSNAVQHEYLIDLAMIAHYLLVYRRVSILESNFLMSLSTSPIFIHNLWHICQTIQYETGYQQNSLLSHLSCGSSFLTDEDIERIESLLVTFCSLYSMSLVALHDDDFFRGPPATAFRTKEISEMVHVLCDVCLGIVRFMYPERHVIYAISTSDEHQNRSTNRAQQRNEIARKRAWNFITVFKIISQLLQQIRSRDVRRAFCPPDCWLKKMPSYLDPKHVSIFARSLADPSLLSPEKYFDRERGFDETSFTMAELRRAAILQQIPFVVSFDTRVQFLNLLVQEDKINQQNGSEFINNQSTIHIRIRRNYFYEDAFDRLSLENEPNIRRKIRVHFVNVTGLDEAGVDGGGLFREFLNELLKLAFHPNRGLFKMTSDGYLYPNPNIAVIEANFAPHYYFLGRILGKAIYEKFLSELPFATFFLQKILSLTTGKVDIDHLSSLDPELYKNLLYLRNYDGNVEDLGLDFTIINSEIGQTQMIELKPNGQNIAVTNENRIEYIHLVANYKLNKQIHEQVMNFRQGLSDVINSEWLRMFDANELRILISGAPGEIDVADWRAHCQYREPYNKDHPTILAFWRCVHEFTDEQKRKLLRFTTSCSRPPLFGFKEIFPAFCIQSGGSEVDRLPTSNTCVNLLKLPEYPNEEILKEKLLYAIQAAAGFEFS